MNPLGRPIAAYLNEGLAKGFRENYIRMNSNKNRILDPAYLKIYSLELIGDLYPNDSRIYIYFKRTSVYDDFELFEKSKRTGFVKLYEIVDKVGSEWNVKLPNFMNMGIAKGSGKCFGNYDSWQNYFGKINQSTDLYLLYVINVNDFRTHIV
jgi:hypothetical protein